MVSEDEVEELLKITHLAFTIPELQEMDVMNDELPLSDVYTSGSLYRFTANMELYRTMLGILHYELRERDFKVVALLPETNPDKFVNNMRNQSIGRLGPALHKHNSSTYNDQLPGST